MPVFAFTVGSLGDFLALGDLIIKLGVALYKPGECAKDYEELMRELELLCHILMKINISKEQRISETARFYLRQIQVEIAGCQGVIRGFLDKKSSGNNWVWKNIKWAAQGPSEAEEIRRQLSTRRDRLNLLLGM